MKQKALILARRGKGAAGGHVRGVGLVTAKRDTRRLPTCLTRCSGSLMYGASCTMSDAVAVTVCIICTRL